MDRGEIVDFTSLDTIVQEVIKSAVAVREMAYSPYSKFKVGAALLRDDGQISNGCNVENAAWTVGTCAERAALCKAISEGRRGFKALAVVAQKEDNTFTSPCGMCRQAIIEFGNFPVYLAKPDMKKVLQTSTTSLLPHPFKF